MNDVCECATGTCERPVLLRTAARLEIENARLSGLIEVLEKSVGESGKKLEDAREEVFELRRQLSAWGANHE